MAFTPSAFLRETSNVVLRDPQHAARLFTDDQFRLAPKHKFLFHVSFSINPAALQNIDLVQRHKNEINMLVKSCDLPNYTVNTETLKQYNRIKNIQLSHKFAPLSIVFHDDNMGLINQLWKNYYSYYYADPSSAADTTGAYNRNATKNFDYISNTYGYDNGSTVPFFNKITIYQMARHEYVSYTLINPIISQWNHNKVDYSQNAIHDNMMTLQYEAVAYGSGLVSDNGVNTGEVDGFGADHYDQTSSPLQGSSPGGSLSPTFTNSTNVTGNAASFVANLASTVNTYQNTQELPLPSPTGAISNIIQTAQQGLSGVQGIAFPIQAANATASTVANIIKLF